MQADKGNFDASFRRGKFFCNVNAHRAPAQQLPRLKGGDVFPFPDGQCLIPSSSSSSSSLPLLRIAHFLRSAISFLSRDLPPEQQIPPHAPAFAGGSGRHLLMLLLRRLLAATKLRHACLLLLGTGRTTNAIEVVRPKLVKDPSRIPSVNSLSLNPCEKHFSPPTPKSAFPLAQLPISPAISGGERVHSKTQPAASALGNNNDERGLFRRRRHRLSASLPLEADSSE